MTASSTNNLDPFADVRGWTIQRQPITTTDLAANVQFIRDRLGSSSDFVIRELSTGIWNKLKVSLIYIDGMVNDTTIHDFIMESFMTSQFPQHKDFQSEQIIQYITDKMIPIAGISKVDNWYNLFHSLLSGNTLLLADGTSIILSLSTIGGERRSVDEPATDVSIRGPREGFVETLRSNTALIRRRIKNPNVWLETLLIGQVSHTDVAIMYIKGIVDEAVLQELKRRLNRIQIDGILESGYLEKSIEDQSLTNFPTVFTTERPDTVAANLLEGKIVIIVDGTPFVLIVPAVFNQFFQISEDYYHRYDISIALRILRVVIFIISMIGPSFYIAATTFHQEMIPTQLIISIASQREAVPFPAFIEAVIMEIIFEILREAGVRLPKAIGPTVSIVGALVIGQAAVQAGLVSPAMVIVVAITAICSFATPTFSIAISARILRFLLMVCAAMFGFYGIILVVIMITAHLCSLRSFGIPYMSPYTPSMQSPSKDKSIWFRIPIWLSHFKPKLMKRPSTEGDLQHEDSLPK